MLERVRHVLLHPEPPKDRWNDALTDLAELQQGHPEDPRVGQLIGIWAMRSGKVEEGIELLRSAHQNLKTTDSIVILSDALWAMDRRAEATEVLTSWIDLHPADELARARLELYRQAAGG
jgi:lipopolysaccharide biosynthesis regulator YciM